MKFIKIQCPAKINLDLKIVNKRPDGFHNIDSTMQTISLFDYLTITIKPSDKTEIILSGNNTKIPYDNRNLVFKAASLFVETSNINPHKISVNIEKNIPIAAGLAGGSTDAAGTLYGLNKLFDEIFTQEKLHELCARLGSDLNVCLQGGCLKTSGRGEIITPAQYKPCSVSLIKPLELGISAKEAYTKFAQKFEKKEDLHTRNLYKNDLEWAIIQDYEQLQHIKNTYKSSMMTGSGSTYFSLDENFNPEENYWICNSLKTTEFGVRELISEP